MKTLFAAIVLTALPGWAMAMGCQGSEHRQEASMSCAEGLVLDLETNTCVPLATG